MKTNAGRRQPVMAWLGVACLGLMPLGPLSAQEPKLRHTILGVEEAHLIHSMVFSPDGKTLVSGGFVGAKLWDVASGKNTASLPHDNLVTSVALSPDGKTLAVGGGGPPPFDPNPGPSTINLWDVASGKKTATLTGHTKMVTSVAFSPDGKTLASGSRDQTIKLWEVQTGKEQATLKGYTAEVCSVAFSPDGKTLASGCGGGYDKRGKRIFPGEVKLWDVASGKNSATLTDTGAPVNSVAFSPDGKILASGSGLVQHSTGEIKLWDVATGKATATLEDTGNVWCVAFSPDGKTLASGTSQNDTLKLWDVATGKNTATVKGRRGGVRAVAFSPDGKTLASGGGNLEIPASIQLWDLAPRKTPTLKEHTDAVYSGGNTLKLCYNQPATKKRPTEFITRPEGLSETIVFKRLSLMEVPS